MASANALYSAAAILGGSSPIQKGICWRSNVRRMCVVKASPKDTSLEHIPKKNLQTGMEKLAAAAVFSEFGHLWTYCENCETSIYKEYAKRNHYVCQSCGFHIKMVDSTDRLDFLVESGTWDPKDENIVPIDPYEILQTKEIHNDESSETKNIEKLKNLVDLLPKNLNITVSTQEEKKYEVHCSHEAFGEENSDESSKEESVLQAFNIKELLDRALSGFSP